MKEPFSEDILSAYLDGELAPEERARFEHRLERDARAREQLEDFRRLSQLFAALPRTELPASFSSQVLQLAERRMLIPDATAQAPRWRAKKWLVGVGVAGTLAAAAAVLLIVQTFSPAPHPAGGGRDIAARDLPAPSGLRNAPTGAADEDRAEPGMIVTDSGDRSSSLSDKAFSREPASPPSAAGLGAGGTLSPGDEALDVVTQTNPQLAEIGRRIQEINDSEDRESVVPVVTVYVADRAEGLVLVQRILEASNVQSEEDAAAAEHKSGRPDAARANEALFVVADSDQVIAAFSKMLQRDHPSLRVELESPIEVASLDREAQKRFEQVVRELSGSRATTREPEEAPIRRRRVTDGAGDEGVPDRRSRADFQNKDGGEKKSEAAKKPDESGLESLPPKPPRELQDAPADAKTGNSKNAGSKAAESKMADQAEESPQARAGRQFMAPAPREFAQSRQSSKKKAPAPARASAAAKAVAGDDGANKEQAAPGDELTKRSPLVRVLIRVESESRPAKSAGQAP